MEIDKKLIDHISQLMELYGYKYKEIKLTKYKGQGKIIIKEIEKR